MDWYLAIEINREALRRIVAMLVAMAGFPGEGASSPAPKTLPRHLHRAILRLVRPAESAVRRLVIVMARGLALPPPGPRRAGPAPAGARPRPLSLPLLDPLRPFRPRRQAANGVPRISLPGVTAPFALAPRRPPWPDDPLDATRLALRLRALGAALDDLPAQARRFARWRARSQAGRARRAWPLRPGRPPGQRAARWRTHPVYETLNDLHGLAFDVLEHPDTS